jgi:hypothetical protein
MSKAKMRFPPVPGDTPREKFMNLARHIFSVPKTTVEDQPPAPRKRAHKRIAKESKSHGRNPT